MIPQDVKEKILVISEKHNVRKIAVFGSIVRGTSNDDSDIDILIEFEGKKSLFDLVRFEEELELVLQRKVEVITYKSLHPLLEERILNEQVVLK